MDRERHIQQGLLNRPALAAVLAVVMAGGLSCDLFESRKPNDPGQNTFPCAPLTAQSDVFVNIEQAYGRGDGLPCYLSSLSDNIVFDFDDADSLPSPAQYQNYNKGAEQVVTQNIASGADSTIYVQLKTPYTLVRSDPDVQTRRYAYEIKFKSSDIPDTLFQGFAEITVRKNAGGQWQASEWIDRPDPAGTTSRTWGYLRGQYRIGI